MLCVALTLVFAGMNLTSTIDRFQHAGDTVAQHEHLPLSLVVLDTSDHGDDFGTAATSDSESPSSPQPDTGHHHHGDVGSWLPARPHQDQAGILPMSSSQPKMTDDRLASAQIHGPERPPKDSALYI